MGTGCKTFPGKHRYSRPGALHPIDDCVGFRPILHWTWEWWGYGNGSCPREELWGICVDGRRVRTKEDWGIVGNSLSGLLEDPKTLRLVFDYLGPDGAGTQVQGSGLKV